jgi:Tol biopolymer transport system component
MRLATGTAAASAVLALAAIAAPRLHASAQPVAPPPTFGLTTNPFTFGQAPDWSPDGNWIVHNADRGQGMQLYLAHLDGSGEHCITCDQPAPNMVPHYRPQGDRILYHSWQGRNLVIGAPGFGGIGSNLYVIRPDGTGKVALTNDSEGQDNYHAYWSPDGNHILWTHLNWNFINGGGDGKWDIRIADYVDDRNHPHLTNTRIMRPANGHFYETQWWAPDGKGFLYTESVDSAVNLELFYMDLHGAQPVITRLTDNPAWDEQAIFTPDGSRVIFMSTRDHPNTFNTWSNAAQLAGIPVEYDYILTLPIFEAGFFTPITPASNDLYEIDMSSKVLRRLTHDGDDGWITPEFAWDPTGKRLLWTELKMTDGLRIQAPIDPLRQAQQLAALLQHPPTPRPENFDHGNQQFYMVERTRLGSYAPVAGSAATTPTSGSAPASPPLTAASGIPETGSPVIAPGAAATAIAASVLAALQGRARRERSRRGHVSA